MGQSEVQALWLKAGLPNQLGDASMNYDKKSFFHNHKKLVANPCDARKNYWL